MGGGFLLRAGASMSLKSGIHAAWILAFARMLPPLPSCPTATQASRAMIPYFSDASRQGKAEFMLPGSSRSQG